MTLDGRLEQLLRHLAVNDVGAVEAVLGMPLAVGAVPFLDAKASALVRLAALIASQSSAPSFGWAVEEVLASGGNDEEILGVILAVAPVVGVARVNRAAAEIATTVGYDLDLPDWE